MRFHSISFFKSVYLCSSGHLLDGPDFTDFAGKIGNVSSFPFSLDAVEAEKKLL